MSELARFYGIVIAIYFRDFGQHKLPHVHASYAGEEAVVEIATGAVLAGYLNKPALRLVREWLRDNRGAVTQAWTDALAGRQVGKIGSKKAKKRSRTGGGR